MALNPTLTSTVSFEQPQQQTSDFAAVQTVLAGVFGGSSGGSSEEGNNADARYDRAIRNFASSSGNEGWTPTSSTPEDIRIFARYSPSSGARALEEFEDFGGSEFAEINARIASETAWLASPEGIDVRNRAIVNNPGDTQAQGIAITGAYFNTQQEIAQLDRMVRNGATSDAVWGQVSTSVSSSANVAAGLLTQAYQQLASSGTPVDIIAMDESGTLAGLFPGGLTLNRNNVGAIGPQIERAILAAHTNSLTNDLGFQNLQVPTDAYTSNIFGSLRSTVTEIADGVDPTELLQRQVDSETLGFNQALIDNNFGHLIPLRAWFVGLDPQTAEALRSSTGFDTDLVQAMSRILGGPVDLRTLTIDEVESTTQTTIGLLRDFGNGTVPDTPQSREQLGGVLENLATLMDRSTGAYAPSVYTALLGLPNDLDEEDKINLNRAIMSDMTADAERVIDAALTAGGRIEVNADGDFEFLFTPSTSDGLSDVGSRTMSASNQAVLDRLNSKMDILGATRRQAALGSSLISAITADVNSRVYPEVAANPALSQEIPAVVSPVASFEQPANTTELAPGVFTHSSGNYVAVTSDNGSLSTMTRPEAVENMSRVLSGPFTALQERFGRNLVLNDALAQAGTSRESNTPGSRHFHGDAIDIDISGMSNEERLQLVRDATAVGFQGFGLGNGILHIDMGERRSWNYDNDSYGGMSIAEVQSMIATGTIPRADLSASTGGSISRGDTTYDDATVALILESLTGGDGVVSAEWDEGEGQGQNLVDFDNPDASVTLPPPVDEAQESTNREREMQALQGSSPEVEALIETLTGTVGNLSEEDKRSLMEYLLGQVSNAEGPR
jgi:hypothetical protein